MARCSSTPSPIATTATRRATSSVYRTKEEVETWRARDPLVTFRDRLIADGVLTGADAAALVEQAQKTIDDAIAWGDASPEPSVEHLTDDVYADEPDVLAAPEHVLPAWIKQTFGPATRHQS